jgi:putative ATP-dependent endonuclease of OLD family
MITQFKVSGYRLFEELDIKFDSGVNIVVGDNEAGKSTLLEALTLALTGRIEGRYGHDALNPYWFHQPTVRKFYSDLRAGLDVRMPDITLEVFLDNSIDELQHLRGANNSLRAAVPGMKLVVRPSPDYEQELADYCGDISSPEIIPVEYYSVEWSDFADESLWGVRRTRDISVVRIDSRTYQGSSGLKAFTRGLITENLESAVRASTSVSHRNAVARTTSEPLAAINRAISSEVMGLHNEVIELQMDQSANSSWEEGVVPHVSNVPFGHAGQGQQTAVKLGLALSRSSANRTCIQVEEPENHMSFTSLSRLVARIEDQALARQTFITTHSSFVVNRLGLDSVKLLSRGRMAMITALPKDTVEYFKRLPGYDTLRIVLARKIVLVEGPSDEIVFERAYRDAVGTTPMAHGIDVLSMGGTALARSLALCAALNRQAVALRDNDGQAPEHWLERLAPYIRTGIRDVFVSDPALGNTLEAQIVTTNGPDRIRKVLTYEGDKTTLDWMLDNKTASAMKIASSNQQIEYPSYIRDAIAALR